MADVFPAPGVPDRYGNGGLFRSGRDLDAETAVLGNRRGGAVDQHFSTGGRGPDVCIEAVGMEAIGNSGPEVLYDTVKQQLHVETIRPSAVREAIFHCRKGGTVFILGVFVGLVDRFPLGAMMNKGLTVRAAQQHGQRYIPMLLERMARDELTTEHLGTHELPLADGARGYTLFKQQADDCVRTVFRPDW